MLLIEVLAYNPDYPPVHTNHGHGLRWEAVSGALVLATCMAYMLIVPDKD